MFSEHIIKQRMSVYSFCSKTAVFVALKVISQWQKFS